MIDIKSQLNNTFQDYIYIYYIRIFCSIILDVVNGLWRLDASGLKISFVNSDIPLFISKNDPNWRIISVFVFWVEENCISKTPTYVLGYFCVEYSLPLPELTWQRNDIDKPYYVHWSNV